MHVPARVGRLRPLGAALALLVAVECHGEERRPTPEEVREHDSRLERRVFALARARISHPQRVSGAMGLMFVRQPEDYACARACDFRGWLLQAEPGIAGGQLAAGYAVLVGQAHGQRAFVRDVFVGFGVKAALLRTWGDAAVEPADRTYAGVEGDFTVAKVNFSLALYRALSGDEPDRWLLGGGLGWGF